MAQTKITVGTDTNFVFIGDVITLELQVQSNESLVWPDFEASLVPLEIQNHGKIDTSINANTTLYKQRITIQSFDTGRFVLPSLAFTSLQGDTFYSDSLAIAFLEVTLDTTNVIFDIKKPREVPFNFAEAQLYIWGSLALLLLLVLILFLVKNFSKKSIVKEEEIIIIPCEIEAVDALTKLQAKDYISKGLVKIHYVELTEILRRYFDREFEIDSLESTTEETLALLKNTKLEPKFILSINELLEEADLVKFAKSSPDERTSNNYMNFSFTVIENCHNTKMEVLDVS